MRYSDSELEIIKASFADNDDLVKAVRKVFLQMSLDPIDVSALKAFKGKPEFFSVVRKTFLPELDGNAPVNQVVDLYMTVQFVDKGVDEGVPLIIAREKLIQYLDQQLGYLMAASNGEVSPCSIDFKSLSKIEGKDRLDIFTDMICRNTVVTHTEQQLNGLVVLAGTKNETVEETQNRLRKDSTK